MRTNREIQAESRHLMTLGQHYQLEQAQVARSEAVVATPRVLMRLSDTHVSGQPVSGIEGETIFVSRHNRDVEAVLVGGGLLFQVVERKAEFSGTGQSDKPGTVVTASSSAYDVLHAGYELVEEERLAAALERYAGRDENRIDSLDRETIAEVEAILETDLLPPADRLRTRSEIVEFLEGRLEPGVVVAHALDRQCARDDIRPRLTERHEIKLTIDEP